MKTILIRSLSGAIYIALIVLSLIFHKSVFAAVLFAFNLLALNEFRQFNSRNRSAILAIISGAFIFLLSHLILLGFMNFKWIWFIPILVVIFNLFALYFEKESPINNIAVSLFGIAYITLPLLLLDLINVNAEGRFSWYILSMFILIWTNDTFAYLSGLSFGKHKLFERISPKKTWEGFFGGMLAALVVAFFLFRFINDISMVQWLIFSVLVSIASVFGDLVESLFKRASGLKDSGSIMPGHGGILDRIDSLLFVTPILYLYLQLIN